VREVGVGDVWRVRASLATGCKELIIALVEAVMRAVERDWVGEEKAGRRLKKLDSSRPTPRRASSPSSGRQGIHETPLS
jgi:hypothetical protein